MGMTTRVINQVSVAYNSTGPKKGNMKNWKMTDELKEELIATAKEDAATGVYGSQKFLDLQCNELEKVAPNRAGLKARAMMLQQQHHTTHNELVKKPTGTVKDWVEKMTGASFGGETIKSSGSNMHIYDDHGYRILSYDSFHGTWVDGQSYEETQVYSSFRKLYCEAFEAEEAAIKASNGWQSRVYGKGINTSNDGIDIQV